MAEELSNCTALLSQDCLGMTLQFLEDARDLFSFCLVATAWHEAYKDCKPQLMEHKYWRFNHRLEDLWRLYETYKHSQTDGYPRLSPFSGYFRLLTEATLEPVNICEIFAWSATMLGDADIDHWLLEHGQVTQHYHRIKRRKFLYDSISLDIYGFSEMLGNKVHCLVDFREFGDICNVEATVDPLRQQHQLRITFAPRLLKQFPRDYVPTSWELITYIDAHIGKKPDPSLLEFNTFNMCDLYQLQKLETDTNTLWIRMVLIWYRQFLIQKVGASEE